MKLDSLQDVHALVVGSEVLVPAYVREVRYSKTGGWEVRVVLCPRIAVKQPPIAWVPLDKIVPQTEEAKRET